MCYFFFQIYVRNWSFDKISSENWFDVVAASDKQRAHSNGVEVDCASLKWLTHIERCTLSLVQEIEERAWMHVLSVFEGWNAWKKKNRQSMAAKVMRRHENCHLTRFGSPSRVDQKPPLPSRVHLYELWKIKKFKSAMCCRLLRSTAGLALACSKIFDGR